jgi:carbonic anhydrase/acetyltransferase-like protein (isoleucine patch superfamily)
MWWKAALLLVGLLLAAAIAFCVRYHRKFRVQQPLGRFLFRYLLGDYLWAPIKWTPGLLGMALRQVGYRLGGARVGRGVTILEGAEIINLAGVEIGDNSGIGYGCFIEATGPVRIGRWVRMGPRVSLFTTNHSFARRDTLIKQQGYVVGRIDIGDDVWLGAGVTIVSNVRIGDGAVIGAGAVVVKDVPEYAVAVGNPARVVRYRE